MKKFLLFLMFGIFAFGDIDIVPKDSSGASSFYSGLVILAPSYASGYWSEGSSKTSKESSGLKEKETSELTYEYYETLLEKRSVEAKEIFTDLGLKKLELSEEDLVELTEIKVGILITNKKKNLALIPAKGIYYNLADRTIR